MTNTHNIVLKDIAGQCFNEIKWHTSTFVESPQRFQYIFVIIETTVFIPLVIEIIPFVKIQFF